MDHLPNSRAVPAGSRTLGKLRRRVRKEAEMNDLRSGIAQCLDGAKKQLDEAVLSGLFLVLIGPNNVVRYGSVAEDYVELTSKVLLCAWATLRAINLDATPDGFAQAAFAVAMKAETASELSTLVPLSASRE
jgi:hypothetical protein